MIELRRTGTGLAEDMIKRGRRGGGGGEYGACWGLKYEILQCGSTGNLIPGPSDPRQATAPFRLPPQRMENPIRQDDVCAQRVPRPGGRTRASRRLSIIFRLLLWSRHRCMREKRLGRKHIFETNACTPNDKQDMEKHVQT